MASADKYRKSGFNAPAVVLCGLAAIFFVYALSLFIEGGYNAAMNKELQTKVYDAPISEAATADLAAQKDLLNEKVRYLDPETGVLCMPIEDAKARFVAENAE